MKKNVVFTLSYKADMQCLFQLLLNRDKNVVEVHKLLGCMFNCIWYRRKYETADSFEDKKKILASIDVADSELVELMKAWCLCIRDMNLILSLVRQTV